MSDCCVRGETDTAQPHCDCLTLCLVFVVNMFVLLALDYMFLCDVSLFRFCVWLLKDEPAAVWPPCWWFPPSMFPLLHITLKGFLYCAAPSVKLKCFVFLLSYCSIQPLYFLWFNADLWPTWCCSLFCMLCLFYCAAYLLDKVFILLKPSLLSVWILQTCVIYIIEILNLSLDDM